VTTKKLTVKYASGKEFQASLELPSADPESSEPSVAIILGPGAGGDMDSGHLPGTSRAFADAGLPCARYTVKPPNLPLRVKCVEVTAS
jgi:hypothetical protein